MQSNDRARLVYEAGDGLATRGALLAAGVTRPWLARQRQRGLLHEVWPGVYSRHCELGIGDRMRAALLYAGPGAAFSHTTAAAVLGLTPPLNPQSGLSVAVFHGRRVRSHAGLQIHQRRHRQTTWLGGWPVVPPAQTLVDLLATQSLDELRFVAMAALSHGLVQPAAMLCDVHVPRAKARAWRNLCEEMQAGARSGGEAVLWRAVKESGLPLPRMNAEVRVEVGRYFVDALWRRYGLGVEVDGRSVHAQERAFESDRVRQNALQLAGVSLLRYSVSQLMTSTTEVIDQIRDALCARSLTNGSPPNGRRA